MSGGSGGAFGGARGLRPVPPEKGVFPLDHFGECKQEMEVYMKCLKEHGSQSEKCKDLAKDYLQCRMERNLMAKQDLKELGFKEDSRSEVEDDTDAKLGNERKESTGFVAGIRKKRN